MYYKRIRLMYPLLAFWRSFRVTELLHVLYNLTHCYIFLLPCAARQQLDLPFAELLAPHRDSIRHSDQVRILELHPRPLIPVIQQDLEPSTLKLRPDLDSDIQQFAGRTQRREDHIKRGNARRQPEAIFVVVLLDACGENALDADTVAAHDRRHFPAMLIEHTQAHRLRVLVAELEDVADLHRLADFQRRPATRAAFACDDRPQVGPRRRMERLTRSQVLYVVLLLVCPGNQIASPAQSFFHQ